MRVQSRGGFVGEDDARIPGQRASDGDALFLAAAEIGRIAVSLGCQPNVLEEFRRAAAASRRERPLRWSTSSMF